MNSERNRSRSAVIFRHTEPHQYTVSVTEQKGRFNVGYGEQCWTGLDYADAATKLGEALLHSIACAGKLSQ